MAHKRIPIGAKGYISASQVANLFGCGYGTAYDLYCRFIGDNSNITQPSEEAQKSMEFGSFFEEPVAKFAAKKLGLGKLIKCGTTAYFTEERPYFICHPDRLVIETLKDGRRAALEIKCVSPHAEGWGEEGTDEIPDVYYFQVQSYFACKVPCDVVFVICLRGNRIYVYEVKPQQDIIDSILKKVDEAHENFINGIIPKSENYSEQLSITSKKIDWTKSAIGAGDEILAKYNRIKEIREQKNVLASEEDALKMDILEYMGTSPILSTVEDGKMRKIATLSQRTRTSWDMDKLQEEHPEIAFQDYRKSSSFIDFRFSFK